MTGASRANLHSVSLIGDVSAIWMSSGRLDERQQKRLALCKLNCFRRNGFSLGVTMLLVEFITHSPRCANNTYATR